MPRVSLLRACNWIASYAASLFTRNGAVGGHGELGRLGKFNGRGLVAGVPVGFIPADTDHHRGRAAGLSDERWSFGAPGALDELAETRPGLGNRCCVHSR